jgi:O-antigen/teichoic acid export membrane protein
LLKNIGSNWVLSGIQILVFMVLTRYVLDMLGQGTFGIWESMVAACGPLQLLILGVPMATVRAVSQGVANKDSGAASHALGQSVTLTLGLGAVACLVGILVWFGFESSMLHSAEWNLDAAEIADARMALIVLLANLAAGFCLRLPYAVFEANHDFVVRNLIQVSGLLLRLGLTVAFLEADATLLMLAWVQIIVAAVEFVAALTIGRARHPSIRFRPAALQSAAVKSLLSFSVFAFLMNMGAMLAFQIDALVIGNSAHPSQVAIYGMGNKIFEPLIQLLLAIGMVAMPMATALRAQGKDAELQDVFLKWSKVAMCMVVMLGTYLLVMGPEFLAWWLGDEFDPEAGVLLQILMVSFLFFLPVRSVALPVLMGSGRPKGPAFGLVAMGVLNLVISLALVGEYGVRGVALGTAIPNVLFGCVFVGVAARQLGLSTGSYVSYVVGRAVIGVVPGLALLLAIKLGLGADGFWTLFLSGLAFVGVFGITQVLFVWRGDRYLDLHSLVRSKLGGGA